MVVLSRGYAAVVVVVLACSISPQPVLFCFPSPLPPKGIVATAVANKVDAIHPGYGFLSERTDFAKHCKDNGVTFVGPTAENLETFGERFAAA